MNKANIRANLTRHAKEVSRARSVGLPYILVGSNEKLLLLPGLC